MSRPAIEHARDAARQRRTRPIDGGGKSLAAGLYPPRIRGRSLPRSFVFVFFSGEARRASNPIVFMGDSNTVIALYIPLPVPCHVASMFCRWVQCVDHGAPIEPSIDSVFTVDHGMVSEVRSGDCYLNYSVLESCGCTRISER
jgi:hypothetical protein